MHALFLDHYLNIDTLEKRINSLAESFEDRSNLWEIVDGIIHYQLLSFIFSVLEPKDHQFFFDLYKQAPYDLNIVAVVKQQTDIDLAPLIKNESERLQQELLEILEKY
jgi:hypothetical protein